MPNTTKKFGLIQPEVHEKYDIGVHNKNMETIEAVLTEYMENDKEEGLSAEQALEEAKKYVDEKFQESIGDAPEKLNTIKELAAAAEENGDLIEALNEAVGNGAKRTELESHTGDTIIHISAEERTEWNDSSNKKHIHGNQSILDSIKQALIDAWNAAVEHVIDGVRHVTSADKELWNTVSDKADASSVPTKVSQLENDEGYLSKVPDEYITHEEMKEYAQPIGEYVTNAEMQEYAQIKGDYATKDMLGEYCLIKNAGYSLGLSIDNSTYVMTISLLNSAGTALDTKTIDFPIESMVVNAEYANGIITLTLQNGNILPVDVSELVGGLVQNTFTIAGIDMKDNITASELKTALGLNNVPNVSTNNQTPTFSQATTRENIASGEKLTTILGKIMKWFADLKTVAFTGSYNDLNDTPTIPSEVTIDSALSSTSANPVQNKVIYSALTGKAASSHTHNVATASATGFMDPTDKEKLDNIEEGANAYTHPSYTARTGVPTANQTPAFGGTFSVSQPVSNATGHITGMNSRTVTIPKTEATTSAAGLMSATDKAKLGTLNIGYGTCSTAAATAAKVITLDNDNWELNTPSIIFVKFTYTNTASNPTFNVNGTGAKSVWYNTALITTSNLSYAGYASRVAMYIYDGTQYVFLGWSIDANTTYSNASLGQGYGTCVTAAATTAKVVTLSSYSLITGGIVAVKFTYAVPAGATMNINSKGAKAIYYQGAAIADGIIEAGDIALFIYNGSQYHLLCVDREVKKIKTAVFFVKDE